MNQQSIRFHVATASALAFGALVSGSALAQQRFVVINGQLLHPSQVQRIERLYCSPIADGRYWYDIQSGLWGYEGNSRARAASFIAVAGGEKQELERTPVAVFDPRNTGGPALSCAHNARRNNMNTCTSRTDRPT